jgi:hypothetical protein
MLITPDLSEKSPPKAAKISGVAKRIEENNNEKVNKSNISSKPRKCF